MGDRRAVSAGHLGASPMALTNEPWKVAVGGNRVESMTIEQIAYAFHAGQLNVRTPLWQPGTSGWQALGNFEQFLMQPSANDAHVNGYNAEYGGGQYGNSNGSGNGLSHFEEADDDPTRMWTGGAEEMPGMQPVQAPAAPLPPARPSARTGPRQVPSRAPAPAPRPVSASPTARVSGGVVSGATETRGAKRGNGVWLAAALVGLVGLGTAVLTARGNWSLGALTGKAEAQPAQEPTAAPVAAAAPAPAEAVAPAAAEPAAPAAQLAKFEEASAFVAGAAAENPAEAATAEPAKADTASDADRPTASTAKSRRWSSRKSLSSSKAEKSEKVSSAAETRSKAEAKDEAEPKAEAKEPKAKAEAEPAESKSANASVNQAAATALATSSTLASSCRPKGGPAGAGKARIVYGQDGEVASVEILTAKFRDTLTGSCVKMVFRRAKIPPFKGEAPTFIKSFTIPEE